MMNNLEHDIRALVTSMENEDQQSQDTSAQTPPDAIQDIYVLIVREQEENHTHIVESSPTSTTTQQDSFLSTYIFVCFSLFLILTTLLFQCYCMMNPLVATITIIPKSQTVTLNGTLQLGRVLPPLTISQSQTTPTTGKGHQDAKAATGTVIFYNGLFTQQFVASGTVYTGHDGRAIVTTQDATIPEGSPSTGYGTTTVTAKAVEAGSTGNIQAGDVSITINNGLLVRNNQFHNGQDERDFSTVSTQDIHKLSTLLKTTVAKSMQGALQGQLRSPEQLFILPCTQSIASDHQPGEEATKVNVTVSQTCSAVAYNSQELQTKATAFLATQARQKAGAGYSLFGAVHVSVREASVTHTPPPLVFLSFQAHGIWICGLSHTAQEQIKHLIAGKSTQQALTLLASLPGVEQASMQLTGFGDDTRLPKGTGYIHLTIFVRSWTLLTSEHPKPQCVLQQSNVLILIRVLSCQGGKK